MSLVRQARGVARGRLDLDHLRAEVAEDLGQHVPGEQARKIEHAHAGERASGVRRVVSLLQCHGCLDTIAAGAAADLNDEADVYTSCPLRRQAEGSVAT
jgi:hypothetical protein